VEGGRRASRGALEGVEDAALREGFASGKMWKEIAEAFPDRTLMAVATPGFARLVLKRHAWDGPA
jgi:hypothetical protein